MVPNRAHLRRFIPRVFKAIIRCIIDCTEFRVECSGNFASQGNTFSACKHTNTFKCLIAVTPNQLCEDILAFRRDTTELKRKEKQEKKKKEEEDKKKGEEMRKAAVERLAS